MLEQTQLFKYLKKQSEALANRVVMVRSEQTKWLPQIVGLFPHYPSHGVDHSDRIVDQLSHLLFAARKKRPEVHFSDSEVYCLLCAAYLHDMGMVVSPSEQTTILSSPLWQAFIGNDGLGHQTFQQYETLRNSATTNNKDQIHFLADVALRQLIADFIRRHHHERIKATLEMHPFLKQLVDDNDPLAFETIEAISAGHGMSNSELSNEHRFPEERIVLRSKVNIRFLTRLLRIGDLLDMDSRRADPMTLKAVEPLPSDSIPHWQQYSTKKHENISPEKIEFTFECKEQETHRILRDWFSMLESEIERTLREQVRSARHSDWKAPACTVGSFASAGDNAGNKPTVIIRPEKGANYTFHDWKLELDHEQILKLLTHNAGSSPLIFIRELIQNALDATRCQMYSDFEHQFQGIKVPDRPTQFPSEFREKYPIVLSLTEEEGQNPAGVPSEKRMVFTIEDHGSGMNEHIITRYFLQVGRSYYKSSEFREKFKFAATSRFGIGFLSVFAVSKDVTVETARRHDTDGKTTGLRLKLKEPRNYLLTEPWDPFKERTEQSKNGTRIMIVLDSPEHQWSLLDIVKRWCVAVEVPIIVREGGAETIIRSNKLTDKTILSDSKVDPKGNFLLRVFDMDHDDVEGQIMVVVYQDDLGEGWCDCWGKERGLDQRRIDRPPEVLNGYGALHGIHYMSTHHRLYPLWSIMADVRSAKSEVTVTRQPREEYLVDSFFLSNTRGVEIQNIESRMIQSTYMVAQEKIEEHFAESRRANCEKGILYKGSVLSSAPVSDIWRNNYPGLVVTWQNGQRKDISVAEMLAFKEFVFAVWSLNFYQQQFVLKPIKCHPAEVQSSFPIISWADIPEFSDDRLKMKIRKMNLFKMEVCDDLWLFTFTDAPTACSEVVRVHPQSPSWVTSWDFVGMSGVNLADIGPVGDGLNIFDSADPVIQWLKKLRSVTISQPQLIDLATVEFLWQTTAQAPWKMSEIIQKWNDDPKVPTDLKPPKNSQGSLFRLNIKELRGRSTLK